LVLQDLDADIGGVIGFQGVAVLVERRLTQPKRGGGDREMWVVDRTSIALISPETAWRWIADPYVTDPYAANGNANGKPSHDALPES
jgi:hypothetical protein